jgi:hypothetical protein
VIQRKPIERKPKLPVARKVIRDGGEVRLYEGDDLTECQFCDRRIAPGIVLEHEAHCLKNPNKESL